MPFRQTERLPHEQNKKTEREFGLKMMPRKRQQQQIQQPECKLNFLGCTVTLGSTGFQGPLSLPCRAVHSHGDMPSSSANHWVKWIFRVPLPPFWALLLLEQRHSLVLLPLPHALFFPSQCYSFSDEFVRNKVCHGHCRVLECFGKKPACQLNHLNYAR